MVWEFVATGIVAFLAGAVGSTVLWLTVGSRIVAKGVITHAKKAFWDGVAEMVPDHPENQPADPRVAKLAAYFASYAEKSIMGAFGQIERRVGEAVSGAGDALGASGGAGAGLNLSSLLGALPGAGKSPAGGIAGLATLLQMFQSLQGGGNGGGWKE